MRMTSPKTLKGLAVAVLGVAVALTVQASLAGAAAKPASKTIRIGYVLPDLSNPYIASLRNGAVAQAKKQGVTLLVAGTNDSAGQTNAFLNYVGAKVDVIAVDPIDGKAIVSAVRKANAAGIPVIAVGSKPSSGKLASFINVSVYKGGALVGKAITEYCKNIDPCKVGIVQGNPADEAGIGENAGALATIKSSPNIHVVGAQPTDYDPAKALNVATNLLTANPDINYIYAWWDQGALAALEAARSQGKAGKIGISGFGGTCANLAEVIKGTIYQESVQFPDYMGQLMVGLAVKAAAGKKLPANTPAPIVSVTYPLALKYLNGSAKPPEASVPLLAALRKAKAGCK